MHRTLAFLLLAGLAAAQDNPFNKPPADVDAALRARITEFYDLHVKGQFRKADALVADDTKDYYFNGAKPKYMSFEISRIDYFDNYTRAKAVILCEMFIMMPGFADKPVKMPTPSAWKIESDGKWYWYVDQTELRKTPFGMMVPGPDVKTVPGSATPVAARLPQADMSADFLFRQVQVDKKEVQLWAGDSTEVAVGNSAPGDMEVRVFAMPEGVDARMPKTTLHANETVKLKISTASGARSGVVQLRVEQTGQLIPIEVKLK